MSMYLSLTEQLISCPWEANSSSASTIFHIMWHLQVVYLFTAACQLSLCWARQIQSMPSHHSWRSIWVLSSQSVPVSSNAVPVLSLIWLPKKYPVSSTNREAPHYAVSPVPSTSSNLGPNISSCPQHVLSLNVRDQVSHLCRASLGVCLPKL